MLVVVILYSSLIICREQFISSLEACGKFIPINQNYLETWRKQRVLFIFFVPMPVDLEEPGYVATQENLSLLRRS